MAVPRDQGYEIMTGRKTTQGAGAPHRKRCGERLSLLMLAWLLAGSVLAGEAQSEGQTTAPAGEPPLAEEKEPLTPSELEEAKALAKSGLKQGLRQLPLDIEADFMEHDTARQEIRAGGTVRVLRADDLRLRANKALIRLDSREVEAEDGVELERDGDRFSGKKLHFQMDQEKGFLEDAKVDLAGIGGKATARRIDLKDRNHAALQGATFTNCECEPAPWYLAADNLDLDYETNQGKVRNATLYMKGVPIAYTPYWQHPVRKVRTSGYLVPDVRYSRSNGLELDIPYYWNIAPDRDATLTFHPTTRRGPMGKVQFRYLGANYKGSLETHNIFDMVQDDYRSLTLFDHRQTEGDWNLMAHIEASRSRDFIHDFEQNLVDSGSRYLESKVTANRFWDRRGGYSGVEGGFFWTEDLEAISDEFTVQQLPYLVLSDVRSLGNSAFELQTQGRMDNFYQLAGDYTQRVDLFPRVEWRGQRPYGRLKVLAGVEETGWWMQNDPQPTARDGEDWRHRESGVFALRGDSLVERWFGKGSKDGRLFRHTLEPAAQYVMHSSTAQNHLPNYDAFNIVGSGVVRDFSVANLFAYDQISGTDRIGSGQWMAYGLTSRLFGPPFQGEGIRELGSVTVGQRWAPEGHREYQEDRATSDVVAGVSLYLSEKWSLLGDWRFDHHHSQTRAAGTDLVWESPRGDQYDFGLRWHRFPQEEDIEDFLVGSKVRLSDTWVWDQKVTVSTADQKLKDLDVGFTYQHECWSLRLGGGHKAEANTTDHGGEWVGFKLIFRGLGGYGADS
ncbi:MAG: LPS-assembly protein LptD [Magnetococcales bacterium]|nr:LPS-assembly protein LptD [Magnetococcales bacterium]